VLRRIPSKKRRLNPDFADDLLIFGRGTERWFFGFPDLSSVPGWCRFVEKAVAVASADSYMLIFKQ
jgi:hypothetical protein